MATNPTDDPDFIDDPDNPEWTEEDFKRARPFKEVHPELYKSLKKMGRPTLANPKTQISFRLAADVIEAIRGSGKGYNARVERVLRDAINDGKL